MDDRNSIGKRLSDGLRVNAPGAGASHPLFSFWAKARSHDLWDLEDDPQLLDIWSTLETVRGSNEMPDWYRDPKLKDEVLDTLESGVFNTKEFKDWVKGDAAAPKPFNRVQELARECLDGDSEDTLTLAKWIHNEMNGMNPKQPNPGDGEGPDGEDSGEGDLTKGGDKPAGWDQAKSQAKKAMENVKVKKAKDAKKAGQARPNARGGGRGKVDGFQVEDHGDVPGFPVNVSGIRLDTMDEPEYAGLSYDGLIGMDTWELNLANLNCYDHEEPKRGKMVIAVDMSGSMGNYCASDNEDYCGGNRYWGGNGYEHNGSIAWKAAAGLARATNDVRVYGYSGSRGLTSVFEVPPGMRPSCDLGGGGTPDNVMLAYLEQTLQSEAEGAMVVFICDGGPGDWQDTARRAKQLREAGANFIYVVVGTDSPPDNLYPTDVTIAIPSSNELHKLGPGLQRISEVLNGV